jgi:hypothetical protein
VEPPAWRWQREGKNMMRWISLLFLLLPLAVAPPEMINRFRW